MPVTAGPVKNLRPHLPTPSRYRIRQPLPRLEDLECRITVAKSRLEVPESKQLLLQKPSII